MKVLIDADGCPVVDIAIKICKSHKTEIILICDTCHVFNKENVKTVTVDKGADSADFKLVNMVSKGDIIVTQDYGLAAMCLAKRGKVLSQNGMIYNDDNIDSLLLSRHTAKKIRNAGGRLKGPSKRTQQQTQEFIKVFTSLLEEN